VGHYGSHGWECCGKFYIGGFLAGDLADRGSWLPWRLRWLLLSTSRGVIRRILGISINPWAVSASLVLDGGFVVYCGIWET